VSNPSGQSYAVVILWFEWVQVEYFLSLATSLIFSINVKYFFQWFSGHEKTHVGIHFQKVDFKVVVFLKVGHEPRIAHFQKKTRITNLQLSAVLTAVAFRIKTLKDCKHRVNGPILASGP
jgi:hypothetical protein